VNASEKTDKTAGAYMRKNAKRRETTNNVSVDQLPSKKAGHPDRTEGGEIRIA